MERSSPDTQEAAQKGTVMLSLSTTQIAARLGVSERTAYRWIERGWLKATKEKRGNKYSVDEKDLDALARFEPDEIAAINEKYEALEKRIAQLENELADLRELDAKVESLEQQLQSRHAPARTIKATVPSPVIPLGPGDIPARTFAERHGLTKDIMAGWINRGEIETTPRAIGRDSSRTQHMLTPAQQAGAIQFWQSRGVEYNLCSECPHKVE